MEDENLYDEFGNYIGPEIDVSEDSDDNQDSDEGKAASPNGAPSSDYAYERPVSTISYILKLNFI